MPIETICHGCAKKLRVGDEHAGKQARCPACGEIYTVPHASPLSYVPPAAASAAGPTMPAKVASDRWFLRIDDGREFGPVERAVLDEWFAQRRIGPSSQLKREGDPHWQSAGNVYPSLAGAAAAPQQATAYPAGAYPQSANPFADVNLAHAPLMAGMPAPGSYVEPHRGPLILALALISWFSGCFFLGIAAWMLAATDMPKMRSGRMDYSGYSLTQAGMIIGAIHSVLGVLAMVFMLLACLGGALN